MSGFGGGAMQGRGERKRTLIRMHVGWREEATREERERVGVLGGKDGFGGEGEGRRKKVID